MDFKLFTVGIEHWRELRIVALVVGSEYISPSPAFNGATPVLSLFLMNPQNRFGLDVQSGEMMLFIYSLYAFLHASLVLELFVDFALLNCLFFLRDKAFISRFIHGWLNLLLVIFDGTDDSRIFLSVVLMEFHISSIDDEKS